MPGSGKILAAPYQSRSREKSRHPFQELLAEIFLQITFANSLSENLQTKKTSQLKNQRRI
jgi:hypothetical protein